MDEPTFYQIRIKGHLDDTWADLFDGLTISNLEDGDALLSGSIPDQAALQGVLKRISSLGQVGNDHIQQWLDRAASKRH